MDENIIPYVNTTEKIVNLKSIDDLIDKINDLLEQNPGQKYHNDPVKFWIAGGAILSAITDKPTNDYDIYSSNPYLMTSRLKSKIENVKEPANMFFVCHLNGIRSEITFQSFESADRILDSFDFTIISAAYDGNTLTYHPRFWQDVATKTIHIAHITKMFFPVKALMRVIKYTSRGYTPALATMSELVRMLGAYGR